MYRHDIPSKAEWAQSSRSWQLNRKRGTYTSAPTKESLPSELSSSLQLLSLASYSAEQTALHATIAQLLSGEKEGKGSEGSWRGGNHRGHGGSRQRAVRQGLKSRQPGLISSTVTEQVVSQHYSSAKKPLKGVTCTALLILHFQNLYLLAFWILPPPMEDCAGRRFDQSSASWIKHLHGWGKEKMHNNINLEVETSGCFKYARGELVSFQRVIFSVSFHLHHCLLHLILLGNSRMCE